MIKQAKYTRDYWKLRKAYAESTTDQLIDGLEQFSRPYMSSFVGDIARERPRSRSLWYYQMARRVMKDELEFRFSRLDREFTHDLLDYDS
jgi:hypothetical protein